MKILTRRQIIEEWSKQSDEFLDSVCCPKCRNIMFEYSDRYFCDNEDCSQDYVLKSEITE